MAVLTIVRSRRRSAVRSPVPRTGFLLVLRELLLVGDGQRVTALAAAGGKHRATGARGHTLEEPVLALARDSLRLVGALRHDDSLPWLAELMIRVREVTLHPPAEATAAKEYRRAGKGASNGARDYRDRDVQGFLPPLGSIARPRSWFWPSLRAVISSSRSTRPSTCSGRDVAVRATAAPEEAEERGRTVHLTPQIWAVDLEPPPIGETSPVGHEHGMPHHSGRS